jgi:sortase B
VVFIVSIVVFVGALAALGAIGYQYWAQQNAYSGLEEYAEVDDNSNLALSDLKVDWDGLRAINPDIVAWVYVPGTPINYPVVQGSDNQEYLHKAFDGSTGWLASWMLPIPATCPIRTMHYTATT